MGGSVGFACVGQKPPRLMAAMDGWRQIERNIRTPTRELNFFSIATEQQQRRKGFRLSRIVAPQQQQRKKKRGGALVAILLDERDGRK